MTTSKKSNTISSKDVNGTEVYGNDGDSVGHIDHLMIDKKSGHVAYAVMHFGGFLGMGEESHAIPWAKLRYDTAKEGYITDITEEQLKGSPSRTENWQDDPDWEKRTHEYYAVTPYWGAF
ncbi:PRC-barrel domain-containing protein [Ahrensia sp. 13_GOM-1096m]|uniref:PRC-barrel domain-containing protein n=1 Tax=Ahrensia sp. 13_GOM-1096m TaxID=1380380 RepID=UPI00047B6884|nr:PRC-barrel domain-containing protein [Ahrensia sp. 13_GOM-1096m]